MAAPVHVSNGTTQQSLTAITVGWPSHAINDLGLLSINTSNEPNTLVTPSGMVLVGQQGTGTPGDAAALALQIWHAFATSTSMASVVTNDGGDHQMGAISTFRGAYIGRAPVLVGFATGTGTAVTAPGGTTDVDGALVLMIISHEIDTTSPAQVSGQANADLTSISEFYEAATNTGNGGGIASASGIKATAGVFAGWTATLSTATPWIAATVVIHSLAAPAAVDATPPEIVDFGPVPVDPNQPVTWRVTDETGLRSVVVLASFPASGIDAETVYDSERFRGAYRNASGTVSGSATDRTFTALRSGGWPEPPVLEFVVTDTSGNLGVLG